MNPAPQTRDPQNGQETVRERMGPRPLTLHLALAQSAWLSSFSGLPSLNPVSSIWSSQVGPGRPASGGPPDGAPASPPEIDQAAVAAALQTEILNRFGRYMDGLERYRNHPYRRQASPSAAFWSEGGSRLLDFAPDRAGGGAVLVVPSLINRYTVLDLDRGASFVAYLAGRGIKPLVLDWGRPGPVEREFSLTDYVAGRLERALGAACVHAGAPSLPVIGYCMGGTLSVALAARRPEAVSALVALATPWDFHAGEADRAQTLSRLMKPMLPMIERWGDLPLDAIQALFTGLQPLGALRKFERFAWLDPESAAAKSFVALEDWLNDGVPLAAPVARECLVGWYGKNRPGKTEWRIAGLPVDPSRIAMPSLHVVPGDDRIVPPESAAALAKRIEKSDALCPPIGHIGMMASRRAEKAVWAPIADWLAELPPPARR